MPQKTHKAAAAFTFCCMPGSLMSQSGVLLFFVLSGYVITGLFAQ
jgi:peptidoglycan/LPS O-acetylase OafA/YrhL